MTRTVLVYRDRLTYLSERFILSQGEALRDHLAHYVGVRHEPAVAMPRERTTILCNGSALDYPRVAAFKIGGVVPAAFRRLRALDPVLVHAHFGPDGVRAIPLARAMTAPLVVSFHGFDATLHDDALRAMPIPAARQYPSKRGRLQRTAARFIAVSEFVRNKLVAQGFPDERTLVRYIGVDTEAFASHGAPRDDIVLFVGRLVEQKGITDFVHAVADIQNDGLRTRAVVIGDGPAASDAARLAARLNARIEFAGPQSQDVVRAWMHRSSLFCVPSRRMATGAEEGFGLVFAEAQAAGLPVVSYENGGIPEAVAQGETGLLAPNGDRRVLASHLAALLKDDARRLAFSQAAVARARRLFDLRERTAALEDVYSEVVREHNAGSDRQRAS